MAGAKRLAAGTMLAALILAGPAVAGCSPGSAAPTAAPVTAASPTASPVTPAPSTATDQPVPGPAATDPDRVSALLRIAQTFNDDYDNGDFGAAYDRWDARSRKLISRADYIRRHLSCAPATGQHALVEGASRAGRAWHVRYELGGVQLVDTWYYQAHRWVFDIISSNPDAARLYQLPFRDYAAAVGCSIH